jgi:DNA polymerase-3 subunit beta
MNINVNQKELKNVIGKLERLLGKTHTIPVLNCVLITAENNRITATANNIASALVLDVSGEVIEPGNVLIDKNNFKLIKKLSGVLNITDEVIKVAIDTADKTENTEDAEKEFEKHNVIIKANRNLKFYSIDPEQFPEITSDIDEEAFAISENIFKDKLKIKTFVAKTHFRQVFTGVLISAKNDIVATNTHYIAKYKMNVENKCEKDMILSIQSIEELNKILDSKSENYLQFYYNNTSDNEPEYLKIVGSGFTYITRLVDWIFPNYEQVIPQSFCTTLNIENKKLQDTLDFALEIVKDSKYKPIVFNITDQLQVYTIEDDKNMSEIISSDTAGEELAIGFNSGYVNDILKTISEDKVNIKFSGKTSPVAFQGEGNEDELYVLVPLRLKEYEYEEVAV